MRKIKEFEEINFPELLGTYVSEEDQRLLDLWDQGLDCDVTSSSLHDESQDHGHESDQSTDKDEFDPGLEDQDADQYSYVYGELSDDELSDDEADDDDDGVDIDDDLHISSDSDSDSESDDQSSDDSDTSDSDSDSESDSGSESDVDSSSDSEDERESRLLIRPIVRRRRLAKPIRVQLLRHLTLNRALDSEAWCCENGCVAFWPWVGHSEVYWDYD